MLVPRSGGEVCMSKFSSSDPHRCGGDSGSDGGVGGFGAGLELCGFGAWMLG